ncbi:MAG: FecR domain-containing protein [Bacteroidota bacterium]
MSDHIDSLIAKSFSDHLDQDEVSALAQWRNASVANEEQFKEKEKLWEVSKGLRPHQEVDTMKARATFLARKEEAQTKKTSIGYLKIAASLLLILATGWTIWYSVFKSETVVHKTANEKGVIAYLPDSSRVWLNRHSSLSYTKGFSAGRDVSITGEVYFEVTKDEANPFTVNAGVSKVTVLGTSFNVESDSTAVKVSLIEGKVRFDTDTQSLDLAPGETGIYKLEPNSLSKSATSNINVLAWKTGTIIFESTSLEEVLRVLERVYGITYTRQDQLTNCAVTTQFYNAPIEDVLAELALLLDLKYDLKGKHLIILSGNCS